MMLGLPDTCAGGDIVSLLVNVTSLCGGIFVGGWTSTNLVTKVAGGLHTAVRRTRWTAKQPYFVCSTDVGVPRT